jgi:hypothetical protein
MSDLPPELQVELRRRFDEAKRGESLVDADDAIEQAERMADDIMEILNRHESRRSE